MIRKLEVVVTPSRSFPAAVTESTSTNQLPTSVVNPSHLETHPPIPRGYSTLHTATEPALDMLGTSITRVARSGYTPSSARAHLTAASYPFPWCSLSDHQRRHSSSKASIPPNGASRGRAAAAPAQQTSTSSTGRVSRRKTKVAVIESRFARLPSVPSTEHLNEAGMYSIVGTDLARFNGRISTNLPLTIQMSVSPLSSPSGTAQSPSQQPILLRRHQHPLQAYSRRPWRHENIHRQTSYRLSDPPSKLLRLVHRKVTLCEANGKSCMKATTPTPKEHTRGPVFPETSLSRNSPRI